MINKFQASILSSATGASSAYEAGKHLLKKDFLELGNGAMGCVYTPSPSSPVVLKVGLLGKHEEEAMGELGFPKVIGVEYTPHWGESNPTFARLGMKWGVMLMEKVEILSTLSKYLKKDTPLSFSYASQMASILREVHKQGWAHLDAHPGNWWITDKGLKLADWSLARPFKEKFLDKELERIEGRVHSRVYERLWYELYEVPEEDRVPYE